MEYAKLPEVNGTTITSIFFDLLHAVSSLIETLWGFLFTEYTLDFNLFGLELLPSISFQPWQILTIAGAGAILALMIYSILKP